MYLTPDQIQQIVSLTEGYHLSFLAKHVGVEILSDSDLQILEKYGFNIKDYMKGDYLSTMDYAFRFGVISSSLQGMSKGLTYEGLKNYIRSGKFVPLTKYEKDVLLSVKQQSLRDIKGLGDKVGGFMRDVFIKGDQTSRLNYEAIIRDEAKKVVEDRKSVRDMVSEIGKKTGDWNRDLSRISDYVMHTAFDEGRAIGIEREGGQDSEVYKDVYLGACPSCSKLYTTAGIGSKPKIFKLKELLANGNNIGRKQSEWKPVIGSTHPWCFVDSRVRIYTSRGWVSIKNIIVGDEVLTHKGRFRKVTSLIFRENTAEDVPGYYNLSVLFREKKLVLRGMTKGHPLLINGRWVGIEDIKVGDRVSMMMELHSKDYRAEEYEVQQIEYKLVGKERKTVRTYNISVEEDESYVVEGFVSHNCRCTVNPVPEFYDWNPETKMWDKLKERQSKFKRRKVRVKIGEEEQYV